jgi:hypothetical protein
MKIVITVEVPEGAAVAVDSGATTESAAKPVKAVKPVKAAAATASAPPAANQPQAASAPAAQPAQSPAVPTSTLIAVNKATQALAGVDREAAVAILTAFGATTVREGKTIVNTSLLKPEQYQEVVDAMEEKKAAMDAAATQVSLV